MITKKFISVVLSFLILFNAGNLKSHSAIDYLGPYDPKSNFGIANIFNLFVFGNINQKNVDSEGRVAVGGNATFANYGVGSKLVSSTTRADLIIGGNVDITNSHNSSGNTVVSSSSNIIRYNMSHSNGVLNQPIRADIIDFASVKGQLTNSSKYWSNSTVNGTIKVMYGSQLIMEGNDTKLNVFKFNGNNIDGKGLSFNQVSQININVPENSTVLINVGGDNIGFGNYSIFFKGSNATSQVGQYFLWNFYDATKLWNGNITIKGSVLAPNADWVANGNGNVEGNFIVNSLVDGPSGSHLEAHNYLFKGNLPSLGGSNSTPTVPNYSVTTKEDTPVSGTVVGTDVDGDILIYKKSTDPSNGKVVVNSDGKWTYTPNKDYTGTDSFRVEVDDGKAGTAISTITITVTPDNDPPTVPNYSVTTKEDTLVSGTVVGTDVDGDLLIYKKSTDPSNGKVVVNSDGKWTYTPNKDYTGTDSFRVEVDDGKGGIAISTITITVTPDNDPPTVPNYSVTTKEDTPVSGTVVGTDVDGDILIYKKSTDPSNGKVVVNSDGKWTYTPNKDYTGTDSFRVEVDDGKGGTAISTITITITPTSTPTSTSTPTPTSTSTSTPSYNPPIIVIYYTSTPVPTPTPIPTIVKEEPTKVVPKEIIKIKSDIAVLIDSSTMRAEENGSVKYTVTYFNKKDNNVDKTIVRVNIPDKMLFVNADNNGKTAGNDIIWDIGTLKGNGKGTLSFNLKVKPLEEIETLVSLIAKIYSEDEVVELINLEDDQSKIETMLFTNKNDHYHKRYIMGYPDGNVRPKGLITRAEVAAIFARVLDLKANVKGRQVYKDVNLKFWAAGYIEVVSEKGLFSGYKDNSFRPNKPITRAELATVVANYLKVNKSADYQVLIHNFKDLAGHWAEASIEEIYRYQIINGYKDGTFMPDKTITREETIKMVNQMLYRGPLKGVKPSYPDNLVTNWSFGHIEEATRSHTSKYDTDGSENLLIYTPEELW
jgi:choice-of-anchor A domain-containing protein